MFQNIYKALQDMATIPCQSLYSDNQEDISMNHIDIDCEKGPFLTEQIDADFHLHTEQAHWCTRSELPRMNYQQ